MGYMDNRTVIRSVEDSIVRFGRGLVMVQPVQLLESVISGSISECMKFDMHLHSCYSSDSSIPVKTIVKSYVRTAILPLVCDHNSIAGSQKVYDILCKGDPNLPRILAEEIMTSDGEIIGLFLNEEIKPFLSADETLDEISDQGALSIVPHPFCSYRSSVLRFDVMEKIIDRIDIIEGFNSRVLDDWDNAMAQGYAGLHRKPVSAGSDAHTSFELGNTYVSIEQFSDPKSLLKALPDARVHYVHTHPFIHAVTRLVKAGRRMGILQSPLPDCRGLS
jgi:predicted metal-dependent phosphoesterase TrpH